VINCTANFFVYLIFGQSFRRTLIKIICHKEDTKGAKKPAELASGGTNLLLLMPAADSGMGMMGGGRDEENAKIGGEIDGDVPINENGRKAEIENLKGSTRNGGGKMFFKRSGNERTTLSLKNGIGPATRMDAKEATNC
jgi:hypothetical protein